MNTSAIVMSFLYIVFTSGAVYMYLRISKLPTRPHALAWHLFTLWVGVPLVLALLGFVVRMYWASFLWGFNVCSR